MNRQRRRFTAAPLFIQLDQEKPAAKGGVATGFPLGIERREVEKRILRSERKRLTASTTFLVYMVSFSFERHITKMRTNIDSFANTQSNNGSGIHTGSRYFSIIRLNSSWVDGGV